MESIQSKRETSEQKNKYLSNNETQRNQFNFQPEKKQTQKELLNQSQIMKLINQQQKSLCKIKTKKTTSSGFLCCIPDPVLITSNNVLDEEEIKTGNKIIISFNDEKIFKEIIIDKNRIVFTIKKTDDGVEINATIIEIRPFEDNLLEQEFLELDENVFKNDLEYKYKSKNIYLIHYKLGENSTCSTGIINNVNNNKYEIEHNANIDYGSDGCPILLYNNKVIAVQGKKNTNGKFNKGILLNLLINKYNEKYETKNKINCPEKNEITNNEIEQIKNQNQNFVKQKIIRKIEPISGEQLKIIMEQMENKLCKIYMNNGGFGSGFFCIIPFPDKLNQLPVLFTCNHVLKENDIENGKTIKFTLQDKNK